MTQSEWTIERTRAGENRYAELFGRVVRQGNPDLSESEVRSKAAAMQAAEARGINPFQRDDALEE